LIAQKTQDICDEKKIDEIVDLTAGHMDDMMNELE
jgi:hypothetical protein